MATRRLEKSRPSPLLLDGKSFSFYTSTPSLAPCQRRGCAERKDVCAMLVWCGASCKVPSNGAGQEGNAIILACLPWCGLTHFQPLNAFSTSPV